jgi:hypothetical protein
LIGADCKNQQYGNTTGSRRTNANGYNTEQPKRSHGLTLVHRLYERNLAVMAALVIHSSKSHTATRLIFMLSSYNLTHCTLMTRLSLGKHNSRY